MQRAAAYTILEYDTCNAHTQYDASNVIYSIHILYAELLEVHLLIVVLYLFSGRDLAAAEAAFPVARRSLVSSLSTSQSRRDTAGVMNSFILYYDIIFTRL